MDFSKYQELASDTAIYPDFARIIYPALGLVNEAGEVAGKIKKVIRDNKGNFSQEHREKIADELGDVLWYISALASDLGMDLNNIAKNNILKLESRKERNVLGGSGDNR